MTDLKDKSYPGADASTDDVLYLASWYYQAAFVLWKETSRITVYKYDPLAFMPARLLTIHAIELCLNAFLRHEGLSAKDVRARQHDINEPSFIKALKLKPKTANHLRDLTARREYLAARYAPERSRDLSEINRLEATLAEVMVKVTAYIRSGETLQDQ